MDQTDGALGGRAGDGPVGTLATCALLVLAVCMLVTFVSATLTIAIGGMNEESRAASNIYHMHGLLMRLGAAAGATACLLSMFVGAGGWRRRNWTWCTAMVAAGLATVVASHAFLAGTWILGPGPSFAFTSSGFPSVTPWS